MRVNRVDERPVGVGKEEPARVDLEDVPGQLVELGLVGREPLRAQLGVERRERVAVQHVEDEGARAEQQRRGPDEAKRVAAERAAVGPADDRHDGHEHHGGDLGMEGEPQTDGGKRAAAASPLAIVLGGRAHHEVHTERQAEREDDVRREHRGPGDVERQDGEEERRDDARAGAPQAPGEYADEDDAQGIEYGDRRDESRLAQAEQPAGEHRRDPPREPIAVRSEVHVAVVDDRQDVVAQQEIVAEPETAEVPQPQAHRHEENEHRRQEKPHAEACHYAGAGGKASWRSHAHAPARRCAPPRLRRPSRAT